MDVDALHPMETFCVFFARGFVEDAWRAATTSSRGLIDAESAPAVGFCERLHFETPLLDAMRRANANRDDASIYALATELVRARSSRGASASARRSCMRTSIAR